MHRLTIEMLRKVKSTTYGFEKIEMYLSSYHVHLTCDKSHPVFFEIKTKICILNMTFKDMMSKQMNF